MPTPFEHMIGFLKNEDGAITIESVLWLPIYVLFLVMIVDVSLMFNGQAQARRTLQDINRLASSGYYVSEADVEARARSLLGHLSDELEVDATIDTDLGIITATALTIILSVSPSTSASKLTI